MTHALSLARACRPRQWSKNVLVFAAPAAGGVLGEGPILWRSLVAFAVFCLVSSATYLINDVRDVEADRQHPRKRFRPIAAGDVSVRLAVTAAVVLGVVGLGAAAYVSMALLVTSAIYVVLSLCYSVRLKNIAVLDIGVVAGLFMVRAIAGGAATGVPLSSWFLVVTSFSALFIVAGKRSSEMRIHADAGMTSARATLTQYSETVLRQISTISAAVAIAAYAIWSFQRADTADFHATLFHLSAVPFTLAFFRYALMIDRGDAEAPEHAITSDRVLLGIVLAWFVVFAVAVYN